MEMKKKEQETQGHYLFLGIGMPCRHHAIVG